MSPHPTLPQRGRDDVAAPTPSLPRERGREEQRIWRALAEINDPEMPINLVDLGVVYGIALEDRTVRVRLTFTAMGCPASDMIIGDIRERLLAEPGVDAVAIDIVWDPPWSAARMTVEGREALRAWGLSV
ncbi:MAG: metal-sulfur cluster assembly factor [Chloroflexi bacterium]|nr:MAG: metal-sulfur cluster assembly factor [Chloroflexota bacterium]